MRYRILAAAIIEGHLLLVERFALGTSLVVAPLPSEDGQSIHATSIALPSDDEITGMMVVSAKFRTSSTMHDSILLLNHDQDPKYQREYRLRDLLKEENKGSDVKSGELKGDIQN